MGEHVESRPLLNHPEEQMNFVELQALDPSIKNQYSLLIKPK